MAKRKTAKEKLHNGQVPELAEIPERMQKQHGRGMMLIPTPLQVDELIRQIPKGRAATTSALRQALATKAGAQTACPLCTGIFWRISAEAAEEDRQAGTNDITPWWRLVRDNGAVNEKLPGGAEGHAALLQAEGHQVEKNRIALGETYEWE